MPVKNVGKYISFSIESILTQSFKNFELIILNDNSTDDTLEFVNQYLKQDKRIVLIDFKESLGISRVLNFGVKIAKGEYIARMDGDDISHVNRLDEQIRYLKSNSDLAFIGCNISYIDSFGENIRDSKLQCFKYLDVLRYMPFKNVFFHPTLIFRQKILISYEYNHIYNGCEDYELIYRILLKFKGENLNMTLLKYRISETQVTARIDFKRDLLNIKIKLFYFFRFRYLLENKIFIKYYYCTFRSILLFIKRWKHKLYTYSQCVVF